MGFNHGESEGIVTMVDLNGDGLADKVFKQDGRIYFRPNQSGPDGTTTFGPAEEIDTLTNISKDSSETVSFGTESYFGVSVMANTTHTFSTGSVYFSDVNGDGLIDLVEDGVVLFNRLVAGKPTFYLDSSGTPVPVGAGEIDTEGIIDDFTEIYEQKIDLFPLMDTVRCWRAPYAGTIAITAPVMLQDVVPDSYRTADGVRVAIQHNTSELWYTVINAGDDSLYNPVGLDSIQVNKGDRIYFRVQSVFDGAYDQVEWDPEIIYVNATADGMDVNNLDPYYYKATEDFIYAGRGGEIVAPIDGSIRIQGDLKKHGVTSDNIRMVIYKNDNAVIQRSMGWDATGDITVLDDIYVAQDDKLKLRVHVDSPIDMTKLEWAPEAYYVSADNPDIPLFDDNGEPTICLNALYDMDLYPNNILTAAQQWVDATHDGVLYVHPQLTLTEEAVTDGIDGQVVYTTKRPDELVQKRIIQINNGYVNYLQPQAISVTEGDRLFFDFSIRDPNLRAYIQTKNVLVWYEPAPLQDPVKFSVPSCLHSAILPNLCAQPYRGWSVFAYNGNRARAQNPINETELVIDEDYDAENAKAYIMIPDAVAGMWESEDDRCWVEAGVVSSSRRGSDYISIPVEGDFTGTRGVNRFSYASQLAGSVGYKFATVSTAGGTSYTEIDYRDINGDRFPDILSKGKIQYTDMTGGLEGQSRDVNGFADRINQNNNSSTNIGIAGNPPLMKPDADGDVTGTTTGESSALMCSLGVSVQLYGGRFIRSHKRAFRHKWRRITGYSKEGWRGNICCL